MPTGKTEKRVFWFEDGKRPNVADSLGKEKDIILHRLAFNKEIGARDSRGGDDISSPKEFHWSPPPFT